MNADNLKKIAYDYAIRNFEVLFEVNSAKLGFEQGFLGGEIFAFGLVLKLLDKGCNTEEIREYIRTHKAKQLISKKR